MAPSDQHEAPMHHVRDPWDTAITHSASLEIADSNNGRADDDGASRHPRPFMLNVFTEDDDGLVNDGQSPVKQRR
jgi:hypothetical protein